jgi:hypothetical protein
LANNWWHFLRHGEESMTQMQAGSSWRVSGGVRGRLVWWRMCQRLRQ